MHNAVKSDLLRLVNKLLFLKGLHNKIYKNKGSNTGLLDFFECVQSYIADDCFFTG